MSTECASTTMALIKATVRAGVKLTGIAVASHQDPGFHPGWDDNNKYLSH
jgi:hypothetical protein